MATNLLPINSLGLTSSAVPGRRASNNHLRKTSTTTVAASAGGNSWWSPIFGWSSDEADYIDSSKEDPIGSLSAEKKPPAEAKAKFTPGCFTEEKARRLRMMTMETETFNEVMYHSAVASRLATVFPRSSGGQ